MLEFKYDTQLLIDGKGLDEDRINAYITALQGRLPAGGGRRRYDQAALSHQRAVADSRILRHAGRDLRHRYRGHGSPVARSGRLNKRII